MGAPKTKTRSGLTLPRPEIFVNDFQQTEDNELLLESISHNINEAIYRSVQDEGLVYINEAFVQMFGYDSIIEVLNSDVVNLYEDKNERRKLYSELSKNGILTNKEVRFRKKDGTIFFGLLSSISVEGRDGIRYFDGAIRDITIEKAAEIKLKYQSEMQKILIDISSKYINLPLDSLHETIRSTLDQLGTFLRVDRIEMHDYDFEERFCSTTYEWCAKGVPPAEEQQHAIPFEVVEEMMQVHLEGKNFYVADVGNLEGGLAQKRLKEKGVKSILTIPMMLQNSCVGFVSIESNSIRSYTDGESSMIQLFANMSVNITSRAQDQKRLHQLLETTSIQNQRLKDFSQITSHNIRASVANLIAINSLLQADPSYKGYLKSLDVTVGRLNTSINNLNSLLNFDNANELLEKKDCNISLSINRVIRHNYQSIQEKRLDIVKKLPYKMMAKAFPIYLDGIFHNLISNAIKYGTTDTSRKIEIDASESEGLVTLIISDFGRGIDLKRFGTKLFKAGVRFQSDDCGSQGMGLFMTKYMVEAMGGKISVKSKPNQGSSFMISFQTCS